MTSNKNLGNAGEFYVLAQLAQRGYIAGKTDDWQTLIDVIATDPESLNTVNIQVKTRTNDGKIYHGASAINCICSQINEPSDSLLEFLRLTFISYKRTPIIFPFLLLSRRLLLMLKGKVWQPITDDQQFY